MERVAWRLVLALAVVAVGTVADAAPRHRRAPHARTEPACPRAGDRSVVVARIADGDTFFTSTGAEVDLAGVLALGSGGERPNVDRMQTARAALRDALGVGPVTLAVHGQPDRYGRLRAQVFSGGQWLQARLLAGGLVRAAPDLISAPCTPALLAIEARARDARAGHWGDGMFMVHTPDDLRGTAGSFQIVEGRVQSAAVIRSRVYLNFGADWRSDFTASIAPEDKRGLRTRVDWKALQGKRVRMRGWLESYNGPMVSLHAPGQIEFLEGAPKPLRRPRKPRTPKPAPAPKP